MDQLSISCHQVWSVVDQSEIRYNYVAQTFEPFMQMAVSYELTTGMSYMLAMVTLAYLRPVFFQKHFINSIVRQ
ncbi:hypothetical protein Tcan_01945 [Toxocara canis]|uniref:Uncharacterized protein n=1 Tax=Toxocara canis TaxID=6265 RepID=A0A0B2VX01_TOXCA|nr:hypothetical protein Tcan_01945 [Toxocara canis]